MPLAFLPPHETLHALGGTRPTSDFTEFAEDQTEFKTSLVDWALRTCVLLIAMVALVRVRPPSRHRPASRLREAQERLDPLQGHESLEGERDGRTRLRRAGGEGGSEGEGEGEDAGGWESEPEGDP